MIDPVSPSGIPRRGLSGRASVIVFALVFGVIVGTAFLGKGAGRSEPRPSGPSTAVRPAEATPTPTPTPRGRPTPGVGVVGCPAALAPATRTSVRHPADLVPTWVDTVATPSGGESRLMVDRDGTLWAFGSGRLEHVDPTTLRRSVWTFADDASFGAWGMEPAQDGGVWLFGQTTVAWFDGTRFRDVLDYPGGVFDVLETADGSLWASTWDRGLVRWNGRGWADLGTCSSGAGTGLLAEDAAGRIVAAVSGRGGYDVLARYDGSTYWQYSTPGVGPASTVATAPDGSVWVGGEGGIARFAGASWEPFTGPEGLGTTSIAVAPDGSIVAATGSYGPESGGRVVRFDGHAWTTLGSATDIAGTGPSEARVSAVAVAPDGIVYAATDGGIARYGDGAWQLLMKRDGPLWPSDIVAVDRDEAWAGDDMGLWHLRGGRWTNVPLPSADEAGTGPWVADLDVSGDGSLWVVTGGGVSVVSGDETAEIPIGSLGQPRLVAAGEGSSAWIVRSDTDVVHASFSAGVPVVTPVPAAPIGAIQRLAVAPDGTLWAVGDVGGPSGAAVARFDGRRWTVERPVGMVSASATSVAVGRDGTVWVSLAPDAAGVAGPIARFDGRRWTTDSPDGAAGMWVNGIVAGPGGEVWVSADRLFRFDGHAWTSSPAGPWFGPPAIAPDGTIFALGPSGIQRFTGWPFD